MSRGDPRYVGYAQAVLRPAAAQAHAHWHTQQAALALVWLLERALDWRLLPSLG